MIEFQNCRHCKGISILNADDLCSEHCATRRAPHPDPEHVCPDDKLTPAVVEKYIAEDRCPFCDNDNNREFQGFNVVDGDVFQPVSCKTCGAEWNDIYHLAGIETFNTNGNQQEVAYLSELPSKRRFAHFTITELMDMRMRLGYVEGLSGEIQQELKGRTI